MERWRPFSVVLALLAGCSMSHSEESAAETTSGRTAAQEATPWEPCGSTALLLKDIVPGSVGSEPQNLVRADRVLFFTADRGHQRELWKSSGTGGTGTFLVKELDDGPAGLRPSDFIQVGSRAFFVAGDSEHGRELWVSDGTTGGTHMVKDIWPGEVGSFPESLFEFNGLLYFAAGDPEHGRELWRSDGTSAGTFLVEDLEPGPEGASPHSLTRGGDGGLYFLITSSDLFKVLMRSDGGPGAAELRRVPANGGILDALTPVGKRLFFITGTGHDAMMNLEVTTGGAPVLVGKFQEIGETVSVGGRLFFSATTEDAPGDGELWRSDGTPKGTVQVKDIRPGSEGSFPRHLRAMGRRLVFVADDGAHGQELWVSSGTASGTSLLVDLEPGEAGSAPEELTVLQGQLFFSAVTEGHGREPWVSDGTRAGTVALRELAPGSIASNPTGFVRTGWDVFFTADDGTHGQELWALPFRPAGRCQRESR